MSVVTHQTDYNNEYPVAPTRTGQDRVVLRWVGRVSPRWRMSLDRQQ